MTLLLFSRLTLVAGALLLVGCSSFERDWRASGRRPELRSFARGDAFAGRWEGRWTSASHRLGSGYAGGRLRCLLARIDERRYEARFKANWMIFTSSYRTIFDVERRGPVLQLDGQHRLSAMFGGVYHYRGRVTPQHFKATYDSSYDRGTFDLRRAESGR